MADAVQFIKVRRLLYALQYNVGLLVYYEK